ncbi:MAG TPA: chemotaxis protein CheA, partial [Bdellovibrionota bacterium]|nr:chemotaxis protein CheA [Bdellovibrionota bacterium]
LESLSEPASPLPPKASDFFAGDDLAEIMAMAKPAAAVEAPVAEANPAPAAAAAPAPAAPKAEAKAEPAKAAAPTGEKEDEIVRVSLSRIDNLNDYVGELIVTQSVIQQQAHGGNTAKLLSAIQQMVKIAKDIQNISMSLRMLPVKPLIQKLQRVVRDTAKSLNKDVQLNLSGDGIDVDKSVLDRLGDPLIHILRNAVDHGLETTEERIAAGKSPVGKVTLSFENEGNHLVIQIKDDGKGINPEVLRKKAIEKGIIKEGQTLSEKQLIHLIFHPGFSTKAVTSEISGRGVGMDVVKTNIDKIGGHVEVQTAVGSGSTFRIQIPLSLAVIEGLIVMNGDNRYVVPLSQVQETLNIHTLKVHESKLGIGSCFELRGSIVPLISLETLLGAKPHDKESSTALVFNVEDQLIAVRVSEVVKSQQIVIKPLGNGIKPQKGWIGSCVLGDGLPTLILSPMDLLKGQVSSVFKTDEVGQGQRRAA